jgi:hypothetical protein
MCIYRGHNCVVLNVLIVINVVNDKNHLSDLFNAISLKYIS